MYCGGDMKKFAIKLLNKFSTFLFDILLMLFHRQKDDV